MVILFGLFAHIGTAAVKALNRGGGYGVLAITEPTEHCLSLGEVRRTWDGQQSGSQNHDRKVQSPLILARHFGAPEGFEASCLAVERG